MCYPFGLPEKQKIAWNRIDDVSATQYFGFNFTTVGLSYTTLLFIVFSLKVGYLFKWTSGLCTWELYFITK